MKWIQNATIIFSPFFIGLVASFFLIRSVRDKKIIVFIILGALVLSIVNAVAVTVQMSKKK
jgi:drug/metabolite transporter (DMT)-like permease